MANEKVSRVLSSICLLLSFQVVQLKLRGPARILPVQSLLKRPILRFPSKKGCGVREYFLENEDGRNLTFGLGHVALVLVPT